MDHPPAVFCQPEWLRQAETRQPGRLSTQENHRPAGSCCFGQLNIHPKIRQFLTARIHPERYEALPGRRASDDQSSQSYAPGPTRPGSGHVLHRGRQCTPRLINLFGTATASHSPGQSPPGMVSLQLGHPPRFAANPDRAGPRPRSSGTTVFSPRSNATRPADLPASRLSPGLTASRQRSTAPASKSRNSFTSRKAARRMTRACNAGSSCRMTYA